MKNNTESLVLAKFRSKYFVFWLTFFSGTTIAFFANPWFRSGHMWAESATNYFQNAHSKTPIESLFETDSGYLALPQRLMALLAVFSGLEPNETAYFYNISSIVIGVLLCSLITLPYFRTVIANDGFRALSALAFVFLSDFETKTFINFSYFAVVPLLFICAALIRGRHVALPPFAWPLLLFILSKPAILVVIPILIFAAALNRRNSTLFFTIGATGLALIQAKSLLTSRSQGVFAQGQEFSAFDRLSAGVGYLVDLLGGYALKLFANDATLNVAVGLTMLVVCVLRTFRNGARTEALLLVGLLALAGNLFLNVTTLSDLWNNNFELAKNPPIYRQIYVGFVGAVMVYCGLLSGVLERQRPGVDSGKQNTLVSATTSGIALVLALATSSSNPSFPVTGSSSWQTYSARIDGTSSICVPIDPLGWFYEKNCKNLSPEINAATRLVFKEAAYNERLEISKYSPGFETGTRINGFGLILDPLSLDSGNRKISALVKLRDGASVESLSSLSQLDVQLSYFMLKYPIALTQIESISVNLGDKVQVGYLDDFERYPAVIWTGIR